MKFATDTFRQVISRLVCTLFFAPSMRTIIWHFQGTWKYNLSNSWRHDSWDEYKPYIKIARHIYINFCESKRHEQLQTVTKIIVYHSALNAHTYTGSTLLLDTITLLNRMDLLIAYILSSFVLLSNPPLNHSSQRPRVTWHRDSSPLRPRTRVWSEAHMMTSSICWPVWDTACGIRTPTNFSFYMTSPSIY